MRPRVTLTFDNGPSVSTTPFVLETLRTRGLNAWFCVVGRQLESSREHVDIAREAVAQGHRIVNHSLTHGTALGDDPDPSHARSEIRAMHESMTERLGARGTPWFRPFGRGGELGSHIFSTAAVAELEALQYSVLLWNCVPRDWEDPEGWPATALAEIDESSHTVVVLHDIGTGAMAALPGFLDSLLERGCSFEMEPPHSCVPMRDGRRTWDDSAFAALVSDGAGS